MKCAIGYIRVSTEEQAESGLGLEAQRERIKAHCVSKGLTLACVYEDPGESGGKALAARPAGAKLLVHARKAKAVVVAARFDRLFRSVADAANTIVEFDKKGIELVSISEGFDMSSIYGKAMAQMASVFAELERGVIRERTKAAMKVKRARGERISRSRFGFDMVANGTDKDGKTLYRLEPNAIEQQAIALMRELRVQGETYRDIAAELNRRGIASKGGKQWSHPTIRGILARAAA